MVEVVQECFGSRDEGGCHYSVAIVSREGTLVEHSVTGSNKDAPWSVLADTPKKGNRMVHQIQEKINYDGIKGRCAKTVWRVGQAAGFSVSGAKHGLGKAVDGFVG